MQERFVVHLQLFQTQDCRMLLAEGRPDAIKKMEAIGKIHRDSIQLMRKFLEGKFVEDRGLCVMSTTDERGEINFATVYRLST